MKKLAKSLAIAALLTGTAVPAVAQSAGLNDAVCIHVLGETAAKLKDDRTTYAVVMNFQGYYTARVRQAIGPNGKMAAALKAGREAVAKMNAEMYKAAGNQCLDGLPLKDLEELYVFNEALGANPPEK